MLVSELKEALKDVDDNLNVYIQDSRGKSRRVDFAGACGSVGWSDEVKGKDGETSFFTKEYDEEEPFAFFDVDRRRGLVEIFLYEEFGADASFDDRRIDEIVKLLEQNVRRRFFVQSTDNVEKLSVKELKKQIDDALRFYGDMDAEVITSFGDEYEDEENVELERNVKRNDIRVGYVVVSNGEYRFVEPNEMKKLGFEGNENALVICLTKYAERTYLEDWDY